MFYQWLTLETQRETDQNKETADNQVVISKMCSIIELCGIQKW